MKNTLFLRPLFLLLLLAGLDSCAVYNRIFHPYRIPTPPMSAEYKAKLKADKAKKKNAAAGVKEAAKKKKAETPTEGSTDASTPTDFAADNNDAAKAPDETAKKQPSGAKVKYNSQGLVKKSKLSRPKPLHKVSKPSAWQRFKNIFRKRGGKKRKSEPNPTPTDESNPTEQPAPDTGP